MAQVDSQEVFRQAVERAGLSELQPQFEMLGWATHGRFAFATALVPGQINTDQVKGLIFVFTWVFFQLGLEALRVLSARDNYSRKG